MEPQANADRTLAVPAQRVQAWLIDLFLFVLVPVMLVGYFAHEAAGKLLAGVCMLVMIGSIVLTEHFWGWTPGKLFVGLRVVSALDGGPISIGQSVRRNIARLFEVFGSPVVGLALLHLTPERQRMGDLWAKTLVVVHTPGAELRLQPQSGL